MDSQTLIQRYLLGDLTEDEVAELDRLLNAEAELRREFALAAAMDTGLREVSFERSIEPAEAVNQIQPPTSRTRFVLTAVVSVAAAVVVMVSVGPAFLRAGLFKVAPVATLVSSENAAWESSLPTTPGSELGPGLMRLASGLATVRFTSGAEVVVEAPANLALISSMKAKIEYGAAVVTVPDSAIGFVVETPNGYAVDYGTQFAVRVDQRERESDFEVIDGEIAVHHPETGDEVRLTGQGKTATVSKKALVVADSEQQSDSIETTANVIRIGTNGRSTSILRNNKRKKFINPEVLSVKRTNSGKWDYRSFFAFDLSTVNLDRIKTARLRLNLVPSTRGLVSALPKINRFGIYGLTDQTKADWEIECLWEDSPRPEDGIPLGTFEIHRSEKRGSFGIQNDELLSFLKTHQGTSVTFILIRETTQINGVGPSMTHMFASDSHPEAVGPMLEFSFD